MSRKPARERYDAAVDLFPWFGKATSFAYGVAKFTFRVGDAGLVETEPEPLAHDVRDPDEPHRLKVGSDFWPEKPATDVIVLGSAHATRPVRTARVSVTVGRAAKHIKVFGRREIGWAGATPRFSEAEPFESIELTNVNAYGGADLRVPVAETKSIIEDLNLQYDHPGVYPRNPFGKGYLVDPTPVEGVELPNLEDPTDLLTPERILVRDPEVWHRQPLPWALDWHQPMMFPRYVYIGADAWYPGPQDATLAEVARGWLVSNYRGRYPANALFSGKEMARQFFQEASLGMAFPNLAEGTPISVGGMHPTGKKLQFALPKPPRLELAMEGTRETVPAQLSTVLIKPDEERVCLTYVGILPKLPRVFIPGLHGKIPLALRVNSDELIVYETPPTMRSKTEASSTKANAQA